MTDKKTYPLARAYLGRVQEADRIVERLRLQVANLRMLTTDTSVHYSTMPHADSPDQQKLLTLLARIDELERRIPAAEKAAMDIRYEVGNLIVGIPNETIARILLLLYVDRKSWNQILPEIGYGRSRAFYLRDQGLAALEAILKQAS